MEPSNESKKILLIFDINLITQAKILIIGLRETLTGRLTVYCIVSQEVFSNCIVELQNFASSIGVGLILCEENKDIFVHKTKSTHNLSYQEFLFPQLFPDMHGKLLYLDIDIVPVQNFDELFSVHFSAPFGAVALDDVISKRNSKAWSDIANGGVQLFNTDKFIQDDLMQKSIDFYQSYLNKLELTDEVVLNSLSWKRWFNLGSIYNTSYTKTWYAWSSKKRSKIKLVHFIGTRKPWDDHITSPLAARFRKIYQGRRKRLFNII
jgi:lipopolysaccharide biosynthesis glycosyltransferase